VYPVSTHACFTHDNDLPSLPPALPACRLRRQGQVRAPEKIALEGDPGRPSVEGGGEGHCVGRGGRAQGWEEGREGGWDIHIYVYIHV